MRHSFSHTSTRDHGIKFASRTAHGRPRVKRGHPYICQQEKPPFVYSPLCTVFEFEWACNRARLVLPKHTTASETGGKGLAKRPQCSGAAMTPPVSVSTLTPGFWAGFSRWCDLSLQTASHSLHSSRFSAALAWGVSGAWTPSSSSAVGCQREKCGWDRPALRTFFQVGHLSGKTGAVLACPQSRDDCAAAS